MLVIGLKASAVAAGRDGNLTEVLAVGVAKTDFAINFAGVFVFAFVLTGDFDLATNFFAGFAFGFDLTLPFFTDFVLIAFVIFDFIDFAFFALTFFTAMTHILSLLWRPPPLISLFNLRYIYKSSNLYR
jgi:hypothetical protein